MWLVSWRSTISHDANEDSTRIWTDQSDIMYMYIIVIFSLTVWCRTHCFCPAELQTSSTAPPCQHRAGRPLPRGGRQDGATPYQWHQEHHTPGWTPIAHPGADRNTIMTQINNNRDRIIIVNLEIFVVKIFCSRWRLRKLACTINANAVRDCSYENFLHKNLSYKSFFNENFQIYGILTSVKGAFNWNRKNCADLKRRLN